MCFQSATLSKAQTARVTCEGVISSMSAQMFIQAAMFSKA